MIGPYIKKRVIPAGMTVTEAARRLGVGRPALSNLLNGKASLSHEMALRLEKTFGADRDELLDRQSGLERQHRRDGDGAVAAGRFVPPFLVIKARDIEAWADRTNARQLLAVLLRTLVHSTGDGLRRVDFPGGDNAQRRGWDGWLEADSATPWIPSGESGWEFGVSGDPRRKAEQDYNQRLSSTPAADRARLTFVFVTPRNWPQKKEWVKEKSTVGAWKDVRALDADDLEQWLEQSIAGQVWFADQLGRPTQGCTPLDRFWERWRSDCEPAITEMMFTPAVDMHLADFKRWLDKPGDRPLTIAADSAEEAVAFVACLFRHSDIPPEIRDRAVVIDCADIMRTLALSTSPFIPIVRRDDVERELGPVCRRFPCIAVRPRNAVEPLTIEIPLLGYEGFRAALSDMSIHDYDEVARLARESGRSPTILRRRLSPISAINTPPWAQDHEVAQRLIPMILTGAWDKKSEADRHVLSDISGCAYDEVEQRVAELWALDDPPVWCAGQYRGVASKIDALFAVSGSITDSAVDGFLEIARHVLSEADPALTLPEDQRWAASMFDKVRKHSSAVLRSNVGETLVLLAVHGNHLLQSRLGVDVKARVAQLIRRLLSPMRADTLRSHERELPLYAEAAPEMFLDLLEADLKKPNPAVFDLLQPVGPGWLVQPYRIGLLRSLEIVAWDPGLLHRVACILARLAEIEIDDRFNLTPSSCLAAIVRGWMPQTDASLDDRVNCLRMLIHRFPDIGWRLCVAQFQQSPGYFNYRPRWRHTATEADREVSRDELSAFQRKALDFVLCWPHYDEVKLGELVDHVGSFRAHDQRRVWALVDQFAGTATDRAKAALYERVNRYAFPMRGIASRNVTDAVRSDARAALGKLVARDPVVRHGWMFAKQWVAGVDDYTERADDPRDERKRWERAHRIREDAMAEIWKAQGWKGVTDLLANSEAPETIGMYVAVCVDEGNAAAELVSTALSSDAVVPSMLNRFMRGFFGALDESERDAVLLAVANAPGHDDAACARLFTWAPLGERTWRVLGHQRRQVLARYWRDVSVPQWWQGTKDELGHLLTRLLDAKRPRAAFRASYGSWKDIETALLKRLLNGLARAEDRDPIDYAELSFALDELDKRADITRDEMARLEWVFLPALDHPGDNLHGIPNLERMVAESPRWFAQAVALCYRRNDGGEDPPDWRVDDREKIASHAYALLQRFRRIPGTDDDGIVHGELLRQWCAEVRRLCAEHDRIEVGDEHLGQLLSNAPTDRDGTWPCRPVCEVMEGIGSPGLRNGFQNGVYDARGVHVRGMEDGGDQERRLAEKWRSRAERLAFDYPFVSTVLDGIAKIYEGEATENDTQAQARMRMGR